MFYVLALVYVVAILAITMIGKVLDYKNNENKDENADTNDDINKIEKRKSIFQRLEMIFKDEIDKKGKLYFYSAMIFFVGTVLCFLGIIIPIIVEISWRNPDIIIYFIFFCSIAFFPIFLVLFWISAALGGFSFVRNLVFNIVVSLIILIFLLPSSFLILIIAVNGFDGLWGLARISF